MKREKDPDGRIIRNSRFPLSLFGIYFGVLLLMSGIHEGMVLYVNTVQLSVFADPYPGGILGGCGGRSDSVYKAQDAVHLRDPHA